MSHSSEIFERSKKILVGGVDSPVRAFRAVGGDPLIIERAEGAYLYDADGRKFLDYVCSWGAMILGHAHPDITRAVQDQASRGTSYGMTSPLESELAMAIADAMPSIEMLRFVSSGTEACMSAIRLARGFTKRDYIVKFEGCYHGHSDSFLSEAGSGLATLGISSSPGVPEAFAKLTINLPYNNVERFEEFFSKRGNEIAAVIVEGVAANMGVVAPDANFLRALREQTKNHGALLICDEVISGFRVGRGGAQALYKMQPDLTILGKIIGGGLPVAAYGGRREIMEMVAPLGPVYQAGTLSGNPLAMRAGLAVMPHLAEAKFYEQLDQRSSKLAQGFREAAKKVGVPAQVNSLGSLVTIFFNSAPVRNYDEAKKSDTGRFASFFQEMLRRGIFLPPSRYEALFVSAAHTDAEIDRTIAACQESLLELAR
jgi:glutamate-1-semialdehyde 2,1-aminomutase